MPKYALFLGSIFRVGTNITSGKGMESGGGGWAEENMEQEKWNPEAKPLHALVPLKIDSEHYWQGICEALAHYTPFQQSQGY